MKNYSILLAFLLLVSLVFTNCEEEAKTPDYVGTWEYTETDTSGATATMTLILTETTVDMTMVLTSEGISITMGTMKGDLSVDGNKMTITVTEIGVPDIDWETFEFKGIITVKPGDEGWDEAVAESGGETWTAEWSVSGDKLTVKSDDNNDGDYEDEDETMVFTKKS